MLTVHISGAITPGRTSELEPSLSLITSATRILLVRDPISLLPPHSPDKHSLVRISKPRPPVGCTKAYHAEQTMPSGGSGGGGWESWEHFVSVWNFAYSIAKDVFWAWLGFEILRAFRRIAKNRATESDRVSAKSPMDLNKAKVKPPMVGMSCTPLTASTTGDRSGLHGNTRGASHCGSRFKK